MRHRRKTVKLGRSQAHRRALLSNLVVSLIEHKRIKTTLAKAKAVRPFAEKLVTLGKKGTLHARRTALSYLRQNDTAVHFLFTEIAKHAADRKGGYTRIIKIGTRKSDASEMAFIEWVDGPAAVETAAPETAAAPAKKAAKKPAKKDTKAEAAEGAAAEEAAPAAEGEGEKKKPARKPRAKKTDEEKKDAE
jgi:large subunit ribosomal protein L17